MSDLTPDLLIASLSPPEQRAVALLKLALDSYNSTDGSGLFRGVARYDVLEGRARLAAHQARTVREWWSILLRRLLWPPPARRFDEPLLTLLSDGDDAATLRALASQSASLVMVARYWHDSEKQRSRGASPTSPTRRLFDDEEETE